jgi:HK97 gp10 family phage protein
LRVLLKYDRSREVQAKQHQTIRQTLGDGAAIMQDRAMSIVAVDTGRLRASIRLRRVGNLVVQVFTVVEYGPYVEYGTRYMQAQPFFRPAYEQTYQVIIALLKRELANAA